MYALPVDSTLQAQVNWQLARTGRQITGTSSAGLAQNPQSPDPGFSVPASILFDHVAILGQTDNSGRFQGSFSGGFGFWFGGFPCDVLEECSTSGFVWTLTPR